MIIIHAGLFFFQVMDQKAKDHFEKANKQLQKANEELFKPREDVVSFLVCKNSLFAIENYLKGYLTKRGFHTKENESLDVLLERCRLLDKKFHQINLSVIDCSSSPDHDRYCEDIENISTYPSIGPRTCTLEPFHGKFRNTVLRLIQYFLVY